ncbi:uncharacterized protein K452DRAFT_322935 [Neofusicoccum parvum]|nr:uncharacterized protein K452DRAFT_322935 [Neofusicoccum parvum]
MGDEYKSTTGKMTYGSRPADERDPDPVRLTFCAEEDNHLPTLTVAQTLSFAVRATWDARASKNTINMAVGALARCFGLSHVLNTKVGNEAVRGVSGGERRRVSLAEAMATCPECATAMSVYQGSDAMVPLFDKVLVINGGHQVFYGNASEAKPYFESLGFVCPERTTITDFLNSMTAEPELRHVRDRWRLRAPKTPLQFEEDFKKSKYYKDIVHSIVSGKDRDPPAQARETYSLPIYQQVIECSLRQLRVLLSDRGTWMVEAICIVVQSLVLGTLFRDQARATRSFFILSSSLFNSVLVPALQSMSEFGNTFSQRPLVIRQNRYRFYRPVSYGLGLVLTDAIWKIVAISYNIPQYFLTGFQSSADKFFTWFLIAYVEHMALSMVFRAIAVSSPNMGRAVLPVGLMFNLFVLYTGLYVPGPQMQGWLFWLKYCNPLYYAFESAMANEFGNLEYTCSASDLVPQGAEYTSAANQEQYGFSVSNLWRNVGINGAFFVFFALCTGIGMERYRLPAGRLATVFYRGEVNKVSSGHNSRAWDSEKGLLSSDAPSPLSPLSRATTMSKEKVAPQAVSSHNGRMLAWKGISLELKVKDETKKLLDDLSGFVVPGQLTALMGASGAGKTTLLNTIAGRMEVGSLSGELFLDGGPLPKSFRRHMGYVQQQDIHLPTQTIVPVEEKDAHVENVIDLLEMESIADALIGIPGAGLNLEQRKRVTIGVELSARPDILFLDEPSSGLDGQSALTIGRLLRKLADSGQTVLCTIHQPAAELIELFDHLVLLVYGGRLAYDGPLGEKCSTALEYFARESGTPCGKSENPAEYLLRVVGAGSRNTTKDDWAALWRVSDERRGQETQLSRILLASATSDRSPQAEGTYAVPFHVQLVTVLRRTWLYYWRDPDYFVSKLLMNVGNALINGLTFLNSGNNQRGAYNRVFSAFMSLIVGPPLGLQAEPRFVALRDIFLLREQASQTYSWIIFVVSAIIIELPYALITSLAYWLLWYFPVGYLTSPSRAGYSFLILNATFMANGFFFMFCNTFAGTLSPRPVTPEAWRWYYNVSPLFYLGEGVTVDVLHDLEIRCDANETSVFQPPRGTSCGTYAQGFLQNATGYLLNPEAIADCRYCRYKDGQSYYTQYGYDFARRYKNVGIFIGFIAFNYTAVIALTYLTKVKKWKRH